MRAIDLSRANCPTAGVAIGLSRSRPAEIRAAADAAVAAGGFASGRVSLSEFVPAYDAGLR